MTAEELMDFDRYFSKLFASDADHASTPEEVKDGFIKSARFTTGLSAPYEKAHKPMITAESSRSRSGKIVNGMRIHKPSGEIL